MSLLVLGSVLWKMLCNLQPMGGKKKKEVNLVCFRLLKKKLLWQSRRRRELSRGSRQGQRRKLPKKPKKPGLGTSAKRTRMTRVNGDRKKVKIK